MSACIQLQGFGRPVCSLRGESLGKKFTKHSLLLHKLVIVIIEGIPKEFSKDIISPQRMTPNDFNDPPTFHPVTLRLTFGVLSEMSQKPFDAPLRMNYNNIGDLLSTSATFWSKVLEILNHFYISQCVS